LICAGAEFFRIDILGGKPVMLADVGAENKKAAN
jgi:hypothetical protein